MQDEAVEVSFCDLCGTSVPVGDLGTGAAVRHQGKLIGACCLGALRGPTSGAASRPADGGRPAEGRLLTVAVVLLAAIAAATIFLEQRQASFQNRWQLAHDDALERLGSDSDVLLGLDVKLGRLATRDELERLQARVGELNGALPRIETALGQHLEAIGQELASVRRDQRAAHAAAVDYRPLLEDLRQRQDRMLAALTALQAEAQQAQLAAKAAPPPAVVEAPGVGGLPPSLIEQIQRLRHSDPAVRFEAVDLLVQSKQPEVLSHLLPLARDPDEFVRRLTVDGLRDFKRAEAVEALLAALEDSSSTVAETAWRSLRELTGQRLPFDAGANREARARAAQRWVEWWDKNKATFGS